MTKILLIIIIIIEFIIISALKLRNLYYNKQINHLKYIQLENIENINLLNPDISYEKFKNVSKKSSIPNSPVRINGDFVDFFIYHISTNTEIIENNIMTIDCEDFYA